MLWCFELKVGPSHPFQLYSNYRGYDYSRKCLTSFEQLRQEVHFHLHAGYPETITWGRDWFKVWIVNPNMVKSHLDLPFHCSREKHSDKVFPFEPLVHTHGLCAPDKQRWLSTMFSYVTRDITERYDSVIFPRTIHESWGVQYLYLVREVLYSYRKITEMFPAWVDECGEVQLVCNFVDGWVVLASVPWRGKGSYVFSQSNDNNKNVKLVT